MKHKKYYICLGIEAVLLIVLNAISQRVNPPVTSLLAFPFEQIANGLMLLAGSGSMGNGLALALLVCTAAVPTVLSFVGQKQQKYAIEMAAGIITSFVILIALYGMMNPYRFCPSILAGTEGWTPVLMGVFGVTIWSCIVDCVILRLLRLFRSGKVKSLRHYLVTAVFSVGIIFTVFCFSTPVSVMFSNINKSQSSLDIVFAILRFAASVIPYLLNIRVCVTIVDLIQAVEQNHAEVLKASAEKTVNLCCLSLLVTAALTAVWNILQMIFMKYLSNVHASADIPFVSIIFTLMILLISRLLVENRNLHDDNDLFI